jgi:DNA mismatch repair protein MutL
VDDLFYNVPARKKFLRARQTEASRIYETCQRVALSHPALRLVVTSEGRTVRKYLPARDLLERAAQVFRDIPLERIEARREGVKLDAALAPAAHARPGARQLYLMVNGRPVNDRGLARAIAFAFGDALPPGHYPRGVVALELSPEDVDVNAHPQKTEIRFRKSARLLDLVTRMLASRLPASLPSAGDAYWNARIGSAGPELERRHAGVSRVAESQPAYPTPPDAVRLLTTVRESILVCESTDELLVIDRERADAVRRSEALRAALHSGNAPRQSLLFPDRLTVESHLRGSIEAHSALLRALGFDWSELGEGVVVVREVPEALGDAPGNVTLEAALRELADARSEPADGLCRALGEVAAVPAGEAIDADRSAGISAAVRLSNPAYEPCILSRHPLPRGDAR